MQDGKIVEAGRVADVFAAPQHPYTRMLVGGGAEGRGRRRCQPASPNVLDCDNVRVHFPIRRGVLRRTVGAVRAVDGVTIAVRAGETVGLVGKSGSGKTTMGLAALRLCPAEGCVRFDNVDIETLDRRALRRMRARAQIVFQDPFGSLSPRLSVGDIVAEGLRVHEPSLSRAATHGACRRRAGGSRPARRRRRALSARVQRRSAAAHRDCTRDGA